MKTLVSIIVPVLNERESIPLFIERFRKSVSGAEFDCEVIFVDDGSDDDTLDIIKSLALSDSRIRWVSLSRNFGKETALTAGFKLARGQCVVPMDVDLQDPPECVLQMYTDWKNGFDVIYGVRVVRNSDSKLKRLSANIFYKVFNALSDTRIPESAGDFRLMDRKVVDAILLFEERNRFMKGLFAWAGFRQKAVHFERPSRAAGETKWNYWRLWNFALDGIFSFGTWPLRVWTYVGAFVAGVAVLYGAALTLRVVLNGIDVPGYASIVVISLFMGGVQLITLGVLGEYVGRIYIESKRRPLYFVRESSDQVNSRGAK